MSNGLRETLRERLDGVSDRQFVDELFAFIKQHGQSHYDEVVTQIQHALQCADLARQRQYGDQAITAALLHDLGHLLLDEHDGRQDFLNQDMHHEQAGATLLADFFPESVTEPIRLHVAAKRYLCTTDDSYYAGLSEASKRSFQVQGGRLSPGEQQQLEANPYLDTALKLRRLDDLGKAPDCRTPELDSFAETVISCLRGDRP